MLVLAIVALLVPLGISLRSRVDAEVRAQARSEAEVVAARASGLISPPQTRQLEALAQLAGRKVRGRVLIVASDGSLVADSAGGVTGGPRELSQPAGDRRRSARRSGPGAADVEDAQRRDPRDRGAGPHRARCARGRPRDSERRRGQPGRQANVAGARVDRRARAGAGPRRRVGDRAPDLTPDPGARRGRAEGRGRRPRGASACRGQPRAADPGTDLQRDDRAGLRPARLAARVRGGRLAPAPHAAHGPAAAARGGAGAGHDPLPAGGPRRRPARGRPARGDRHRAAGAEPRGGGGPARGDQRPGGRHAARGRAVRRRGEHRRMRAASSIPARARGSSPAMRRTSTASSTC